MDGFNIILFASSTIVLLLEVVRFFDVVCILRYLKLTTEPDEFSILGKLHIGPEMVQGRFFRFKKYVGLGYFCNH